MLANCLRRGEIFNQFIVKLLLRVSAKHERILKTRQYLMQLSRKLGGLFGPPCSSITIMLFNDDAIDDDDTDVYTAEVKTVDILTFHFVGACSKNHLQRINKGQVS